MLKFSVSAGIAIALVIATGSLVVAQTEPARPSQWDGVFTDAQADRGRAVYVQHCARCHGADLQGLPQAVRFPGQSPRTPALVGDEFTANWVGMTLGDLFERTRVSMPQSNPGSLSPRQNADILAFILRFAGYAAGESELPPRKNDLDRVDFLKIRQ